MYEANNLNRVVVENKIFPIEGQVLYYGPSELAEFQGSITYNGEEQHFIGMYGGEALAKIDNLDILANSKDNRIDIVFSESYSSTSVTADMFQIVTGNIVVFVNGYNQYYQLGLGNANAILKPTMNLNFLSKDIKQIVFGYYHSLALVNDGSIYATGFNGQGQLGDGTTTQRNNPVLIAQSRFDNEKVIKVAAGERHSAAITESGKLYMWGLNNNGQLGLGDTTQRNIPTLVDPAKFGNEKIVDVGLGGWSTNGHTIALTETGKVYAWGLNGYGQLGINNTTNQTNPVLIAQSRFNNEKVVKITVGAAHSGCITETGKLYMWGNNHLGYLGDGTTTQRNVPTLIPQSAFNNEKVVALSLGRDYSGCLTETGKVYMWGRNTEGQLGDGTTTDKSVPTLIPQSAFNNDKVAALSLGVYHSGCVTETGKVYMWGLNSSGQLGDDSTANKSVPTLIDDFLDGTPVFLSLGGNSSAVIFNVEVLKILGLEYPIVSKRYGHCEYNIYDEETNFHYCSKDSANFKTSNCNSNCPFFKQNKLLLKDEFKPGENTDLIPVKSLSSKTNIVEGISSLIVRGAVL